MILYNIYSTKELIIIFIKAEYIALKFNNYFIMPIHLMLSLLLTNNLCTKLFNINKQMLNDKFLNILLKKYKYNTNVTNIIFSNKVINILTKLNNFNFKTNSLNLLFLLLNEKDKEINYLLKYLNLNFLQNNSFIYNNSINIFPNFIINKLNLIAYNILNIPTIFESNLNFYKNQYNKLLQILNLKIKKHTIILSDKKIGLLFLKFLANNILNKTIPMFLKNTEIWVLKLDLSILTNSIQDYILKIINIIKYFNNIYKLILVIDNIELFDTLLSTNVINNSNDINNKLYYLNILLNQMINKNVHIVYLITLNEYNIYLKNYKLIESFFYIIKINNLSKLQTFLIIKQNIHKYINYYNIYINDFIIYELINLSKQYIKNSILPETPFIILENSCSKINLINEYKINLNYFYTKSNIIKINNIKYNLTIDNIKTSIAEYLNISKTILFKNNKLTKQKINILESSLFNNIYGQSHIINNILPYIKQNIIGLKTKNKPIGSWILCGPSGTGKTELAKILAKTLFGSETDLIRFDMSEYMEKHSISRLIGSPPGYIGYSEGGQLTEQVYKKPNSVILFDEIEKAHPEIYNIMLQILDEGKLTDTMGKSIDFTNTIILFTSNLGCPTDYSLYLQNKDYLSDKDLIKIEQNIKININNYFKPELLNRLTNILIFNPLNFNDLLLICNKFINELKLKLYSNKLNILLYINNNIKYLLTKISYNPLYGARPLKRILELIINKSISDLLLYYNKEYFIQNKYILYYFLNKNNNINYNIYLL
uniref:Caseinolytic protease C n=2 Tax=Leucocytozoon caulleryi TaxID=211597 RepID=U3TLW3_LEUCU|nr:caseinolytic protease C [Leucocytozoon caulleryi]BAN94685.1 caseinolytic protease C [Leucocytozoon caulleryi]